MIDLLHVLGLLLSYDALCLLLLLIRMMSVQAVLAAMVVEALALFTKQTNEFYKWVEWKN